MRTQSAKSPIFRILVLLSVFVLLLNACSFSLLDIPGFNSPTSTPAVSGPTPTPQPAAAIAFTVVLPTPLLAGETLYLSVVDEVTGLSMNAANYAMKGMDTLHYTVTIPFSLGSVVKYRYMRQATLPILEDDAANKSVRYRLYYVTGPGATTDTVASWSDSLFNSPSGRMTGQVKDAVSGKPIPEILIAVGGQQTLTDSNGNFVVEGLPAGTHTLVAYAINGAYQTFQQGARVDAGKPTPVSIALQPATMVNVAFTVSMPQNMVLNAPVRMAGNLYQLGNTFSDLQGGLSTVAARMPLLTPIQGGRYTLTLSLPVGADIRYKYTLGDGFWNAEHSTNGAFAVRQLVVPASQGTLQIEDAVQTWQAGPSAPITF